MFRKYRTVVAVLVILLALPFAVRALSSPDVDAACSCCGSACVCGDCSCDELGCACAVGGKCVCTQECRESGACPNCGSG